MAHHRGHPPHRLVRLTLEGDALPPRDAPLLAAGRPAGRLTTVVRGRDGGLHALGYVRWSLARPEVALALPDGTPVRPA
jgi:folate-binding Fe-S cluster repair protein YgfZ